MDERDRDATRWMIGEMSGLNASFIRQTGRQPVGWVVNVETMDRLNQFFREEVSRHEENSDQVLIEKFEGVPIYIKPFGPAELLMGAEEARMFRKAAVKRERMT